MTVLGDLQFWDNGEPVICENNSDILNLTHWDNGTPSNDLYFDGDSGIYPQTNSLQFWKNGKAVITEHNENILNLTHWHNGTPFNDLYFDGVGGNDFLQSKIIHFWKNGKAVVTEYNENILNLTYWNNCKPFGIVVYRGPSKSDNQLSGKLVVLSKNKNEFDGSILIRYGQVIINLDAFLNIEKRALSNVDGLVITKGGHVDVNLDAFLILKKQIISNVDGKTILRGTKINSVIALDGKIFPTKDIIVYQDLRLMNGRMKLKNSNSPIFDGNILINSPIEIDTLFDSKIEIQTIPVGQVRIIIF